MNPIVVAFLVIMLSLSIFFFILMIIDSHKLRKLRKNYNPDDDKSRQGEERRSELGRIPTAPIPKPSAKRLDKPKGRKLLPTTAPSSTRKDSKRPRGIFKKLRRR